MAALDRGRARAELRRIAAERRFGRADEPRDLGLRAGKSQRLAGGGAAQGREQSLVLRERLSLEPRSALLIAFQQIEDLADLLELPARCRIGGRTHDRRAGGANGAQVRNPAHPLDRAETAEPISTSAQPVSPDSTKTQGQKFSVMP